MNSSNKFLKIAIIYLTLFFLLSSCEEEGLFLNVTDEPTTTKEQYLNHYLDLTTQVSGDYRSRPVRWKDGGLNGTNKIDVFFHDSFNNDTYKQDVIQFLNELDDLIQDESIKFNIVDSFVDADITIVLGRDVFAELFNLDLSHIPSSWWGSAGITKETNIIPLETSDHDKIVSGRIWVDRYHKTLLKHEILHVLGQNHTNKSGFIMSTYLQGPDVGFKDVDLKTLFLQYSDIVNPTYYDESYNGDLPPWAMSSDEFLRLTENVLLSLENEYDL